MNRYVLDNQGFVNEVGKSLEKIGGNQGYFDGSFDSMTELNECLVAKMVNVKLGVAKVDSKNLFGSINEQVLKYRLRNKNESLVFYMNPRDVPYEFTRSAAHERVLSSDKKKNHDDDEEEAEEANKARIAKDAPKPKPQYKREIHIQPNAVFAIGMSLLLAVAVLIWYDCMQALDGPYEFNKPEHSLKVGKEM